MRAPLISCFMCIPIFSSLPVNKGRRISALLKGTESVVALSRRPRRAMAASSEIRSPPRVILGTMTFAGQTEEKDAVTMVSRFAKEYRELVGACPELDTARMYCYGNTEKMIGAMKERLPDLLGAVGATSIATKANPFMAGHSLSPAGLKDQLKLSLEALQTEGVDLFYLHAPDADAEIEDTLRVVQECFEAGKFKRFGLSNFTAWEVSDTLLVHHWHTLMQLGYCCRAQCC